MTRTDPLFVLRAAILGDRNAYNKLVLLNQSKVRRFFLHLTDGDEELSKDLAQETFIKGWLHIGSFRATARFSTWIYRIANNTFYDYTRSNRYRKHLMEIKVAENIPDNNPGQRDIEFDFQKALFVLNDYEKTAMLLFYMEDLAIKDIARIMIMPAGTVKSHLSRGKKKLSAYLENYGYERIINKYI